MKKTVRHLCGKPSEREAIKHGLPPSISFGWWASPAGDKLKYDQTGRKARLGAVHQQQYPEYFPALCLRGMHAAPLANPGSAYLHRGGGSLFLVGIFGRQVFGDVYSVQTKFCGEYRVYFWRTPIKDLSWSDAGLLNILKRRGAPISLNSHGEPSVILKDLEYDVINHGE